MTRFYFRSGEKEGKNEAGRKEREFSRGPGIVEEGGGRRAQGIGLASASDAVFVKRDRAVTGRQTRLAHVRPA